ncbi:DUF11 domain-containing protein [Calothrix sp. NIES-3974]|uniref:DUF11 domain-containing protein n=1 Tax=Calothrix sp. NIES-3974 TaxID=2005462 RepID=UPI00156145A3|nr:DUF11 domain-containing protein [Calothrix sp. NIES-3974]
MAILTIPILHQPARTQTSSPAYCGIVYAIDNQSPGRIYRVNLATATYNQATANNGIPSTSMFFQSAAAALQPSTGRLFYTSRDTSGTRTAYWDPVTNTHTQLTGSFNPGAFTIRSAFSPSGRLFVATQTTLFELNPTTGAEISRSSLFGVTGSNGDMAFDGNNVLFLAADQNVYTIDIDNFSASSPANLLAQAPAGTQFNSLALTPDGKLYAYAGSNNTKYQINTNTGALTATGTVTFNPSVSTLGTDFASCAAPIPTLESTKTYTKVSGSPGSTVLPGDVVEYTVTITNVGTVPATKAVFKDPIPAGVSYVTNSTTMNGVAVADASGGTFPFANSAPIRSSGLLPGVVGTGSSYQVILKYRVRVNTANPPTSVTNQGTTFYLGNTTGVPTDDPNTPQPNDATVITIGSSTITISGRVWNDADNSANNTFNNIQTGTETGTNAGGLNAIFVNSAGNVIATTPINSNGTYTFTNINSNQNNVTIRLSTTPGTVGSTAPTTSLPQGWVGTSPLATTPFNIGINNIADRDFGIEQLPDTNEITAPSQINPGGSIRVQIPPLSGTDPEDGVLGSGNSFRIFTLPSNGILYYDGNVIAAGQVITNYNPAKLTIDPNDGEITVVFTYAAIDAAGKEDPTPATVTIPFSRPDNPNVLLIKRITAVNGLTTTNNGDNLAVYKDEDSNPYDDNNITITNPNPPITPADTDKWPNPATFLIGGTNGGNVRPGDELEYTIYFLSAGDDTAQNVYLCDRIPNHVTFIPTAFNNYPDKAPGIGGDRGILWQYNGQMQALTNYDLNGKMRYLPPGVEPQTVYFNPSNPSKKLVDCGGENTNGAIIVNLGDLPNATAPGTPTGSYGFVRFRGRVK